MTTNREWLESLAASDVAALNAWFDSEHVDANEVFTPKSVITPEAMDANDANATCNNSGENVTHDSREKLEADIDEFRRRYIACELRDIPLVDVVRCWLDRQSAIKEREFIESARSDCDICGNDFRRQRDELQTQVDELTADVDNLTDELAKRDKGIARLKQRRDELLSQLNDLTASYDLICRAFDAQRALLKHERGAEQ